MRLGGMFFPMTKRGDAGGALNIPSPPGFRSSDLRARARARLAPELPAEAFDPGVRAARGDHALNAPAPDARAVAKARPAAVLAPIVARPDGPTVLLTQRASNMRTHSGQIAFPGGKIDAGETPAATRPCARRRRRSASTARFVEPLGWLDPYLTGTGYRIMPLVALVDPGLHARRSTRAKSRMSSRRRSAS